MPNFTYEIKKSGFNKTIVVYSGNSSIYTGTPSSTSSDDDLVRVAKVALRDNYGPGIDQMTRIISSTSTNPTGTSTTDNQLNGITPPNQEQLNSNQSQINKSSDAQQAKMDDLQKAADDKINFLKNQASQNTRDIKGKIVSALTPVLLSFVRTENIADILIKKLTRDTKKQLQNKGTLTIIEGKFTFTPYESANPGNYVVYKNNFDRKVNNIKLSLTKLKEIINITSKVITFLNLAMSLIQVAMKIKLASLIKKHTQITADLASPSPSKTSGYALFKVTQDILKKQKQEKDIETYQNAIISAQSFLAIFKEMLAKLKAKIDQLRFDIVYNNAAASTFTPTILSTSLTGSLNDAISSAPETEDYVNENGKSYTLKLVTLPNGSKQYQALDSFSKMKITQTAPSKTKTPEELNEEIKQILG
jgi:hypothetical protein